MALSNKEKVGRGLDLLAAGLKPFVDRHMQAATPGARDWVEVLAARDAARHGVSRPLSGDDVRVLLRALTEEWRAFGDALSRADQNYASELRDVANRWAHEAAISTDDTARALDTMQRLLTSLGAPSQAEQVGRIRVEHQRAAYEEQTKRTVRSAVGTVATPGTGLKPWREVITPHADVAAGQFNAAEFAADLHQVATGVSLQREYTDPVEFFARTYLTEGLKDLLDRAARRLSGDANASPVVNLQTTFGGGKTHSMLALFHLFSGLPTRAFPQEVQDVVADLDLAALAVRRVSLVGTHLAPDQPVVKPDGTVVNTLWGELAWQLGGRAAFEHLAQADASGTPPGDALAAVIRAHAPVLILIDEWVAYARGLYGQDHLAGGSFESQFTFAQHLTEAVRAIPRAMLVVSIPASDDAGTGGEGSALEVGGAHGRAALEKLQHVVGRTSDHWRPASSVESFEIVRRRLFTEPSAAARTDIAAVARAYVTFYQANHGQFPRECEDPRYEDRIKAAYPIHPELFARLYEDWSTLERFQRTRGVLRLMSTVIHALWASGDAAPLIMPGSVPLHAPRVASELTQYLADAWKPTIDKDVDGEGSTPVVIDSSRPIFATRSLTRRIARTVFLGSAPTLGTAHKGVERPRLWLGVAVPGDTVGNFGSALEMLSQQATYLYADGGRYWYDTTPSVTRTAADIADRLRDEPERVWAEVVDRLRTTARGSRVFAGVHVAPETTGDVPDGETARLVVIHPKHTYARDGASTARTFAEECLLSVGTGQRTRRNTVVFAAADRARYEDLDAAVRECLAWRQISQQVVELNLTEQQKAQVRTRLRQADETVTGRIAATYTWALVPTQPDPTAPPTIRAEKIPEGPAPLADRAGEKLKRAEEIAVEYSPLRVRMNLDGPLATVWAAGHVTVGALWDYYTRYPYLDRLRDRSVLDGAVAASVLLWQSEGFALATGLDGDRYTGLVLPGDSAWPPPITDTTLLVRPDRAVAQRAADDAEAERRRREDTAGAATDGTTDADARGVNALGAGATGTGPGAVVGGGGSGGGGGTSGPLPRTVLRRYFGTRALTPDRYSADFATITQEVIQHLTAAHGVDLEVRIEITATAPSGFTEQTVRTVRENTAHLKFEQSQFEQD